MQLVSLGVIPDGNRRYARKSGINYKEAYQKGFEKARELINWAFKRDDIKNLTFYALSYENLIKRPEMEKRIIYGYFDMFLSDEKTLHDIQDHRIDVNFVGKLNLLPKNLQEKMYALMERNAGNEKKLNFLVAYSGKEEIVDAVKKTLNNGGISSENISKYLSVPSVDLVIRTGNVSRLSGFLTWQTAYSELYFTSKLWPEMEKEDFDAAVEWYYNTERRFGK